MNTLRCLCLLVACSALPIATAAESLPPSSAIPAVSASGGTESDKAKKALDAARLWLVEAKRRADAAPRAVGYITVALAKIDAAKGDIERVQSESPAAQDASAREAVAQRLADEAAKAKAEAEFAARDAAEAEKAALAKLEAARQAARDEARRKGAAAAAGKK